MFVVAPTKFNNTNLSRLRSKILDSEMPYDAGKTLDLAHIIRHFAISEFEELQR